MARWDESEGRLAEAVQLYEVALDGGADGEGRAVASRRLARLYRRLGRWEDAARLWRQRADGGRRPAQRLEALIELAKLDEHHRRDYASAEALTRDALSLVEIMALRGEGSAPTSLTREALEHRLWRLRRRLAAGRGRASPGPDVRGGPLPAS
jgi:tetratricopeptide (TPR) repeat protein